MEYVVSNLSQNVTVPTATKTWLTFPAPIRGRICRLVISQTSGTVENIAALFDIYNSAAAIPLDTSDPTVQLPHYQVMAQTTLAGNATSVSSYPYQFYINADSGNTQAGKNLYIRVNPGSSTVQKTYKITLTIEA